LIKKEKKISLGGDKIVFYKGKSACFIIFLASSAEEIVPTLSGVFLLWKKPCRRCVEHFFRGRNLAGVVGRISPREETLPTVSGDFRDAPKPCRRCR